MNGEPPIIDGEGDQSMDFTHVSDIVQANMCAMECETVNEVFNVGTGISTTIKDLAKILKDALDVDVEPICNGRPSFVTRRKADTTKARELMGFEAKMNVQDGLTKVAQEIA